MSLRLKLFLVQALILLFVSPQTASAQEKSPFWKYSTLISADIPVPVSQPALFTFSQLPEPKKPDNRAKQLRNFLADRRSPLASYADQIVNVADKYGLDWKLLTAISGVESSFGLVMPSNSFNAYGWSNGLTHFESWENSIEHVSKVLGERYVGRGLKTLDQIASVYCPGSDTWAKNVNLYMKNIEEYIPKS